MKKIKLKKVIELSLYYYFFCHLLFPKNLALNPYTNKIPHLIFEVYIPMNNIFNIFLYIRYKNESYPLNY